MNVKKLISLVTALCSCLLISLSASAQSVNNETLELITYDCVTGEEIASTFSSNDNTDILSTRSTSAYIPNASMGGSGISPNVIIGTDNRQVADVNVFPHSPVLCLHYGIDTDGDGTNDMWGDGSGFMVSKNVMLTAAHCMYKSSGWVKDMEIHYYQNGKSLNAYKTTPKKKVVTSNYTKAFDKDYDWGLMVLNDNIGEKTGWFGVSTTTETLDNKMITVSGYPKDHKYYQYFATGRFYDTGTYRVKYDADMMNGQSGGPVYDINNKVWAINTAECASPAYNRGVIIRQAMYDLINSYINTYK